MSRLLKYYDNVQVNETIALLEPVEIVKPKEEEVDVPVVDTTANTRSILLIQRAKEQAGRILDEANSHGRELQKQYIEKSVNRVQEMEDQAHRSGYQKGLELKSEEVVAALHSIHKETKTAIANLKKHNEAVIRQQEDQLKFLALEIASKILHKKVKVDPNELQELVDDVLVGLKHSQTVHIGLPAGAKELMHKLEEEFRRLPIYEGRKMNVDLKEDSNQQLLFECDMGFYDVSIDSQLENLKKLFMELG